MPKPRILLIEDNAQNRILESFLLEDAGMEVVHAASGREGLEKTRSDHPDLILLDIQLPDIDGYELLLQLKKETAIAAIPVVAVTSYAMAGERKRALEMGCAGYIEKPIDTTSFARQVSAFLVGNRTTRGTALHILIVEDRPDSALLLQKNLEDHGYTVVHATNGRQALQALPEHQFDLIITDLLMPEMDGYQFTHSVKSDPRFAKIPIIIYTATYTDPQDRALAMDLGAAEFIVKPAETEPFMRLVADVIARASKGELPVKTPARPDDQAFLTRYSERLMQKLEDKVLEAEEANRKLSHLNVDLEERVAAATADLRATIEKLNAANKELESFAYTIAHDLRAPLRTIRGLVSILRDVHAPALNEDAQDLCLRLNNNAELMMRLIEELLQYSRLGTAAINLAPLSLNNAATEVLSLLRELIQSSHATVQVQAGMPAVIGHQPTLIQVLSNLIANAIKFVDSAKQPLVKLSAEQNGQHVRLHVRDNGIGIPAEYQDRIFQLFERLHDTDTYPGTGLGLAIVRKGMEKMSGTCGVQSLPGQGSDFWIELPAATNLIGSHPDSAAKP